MPNPNPPSISLSGGVPQYLAVIVTTDSVQPDGSNPGQLDTTTPLTFEGLQGFGTAVNALELAPLADGRRVVKLNPGQLQPGTTTQPWSLRVKAANRNLFVTLTGTTAAPPSVSGVAWDGNPVSTTPPT